jgi:transcriptional regulator of acetoin/glycerol metabolism
VRSSTIGIKPDQYAAPSLGRNSATSKSAYDNAELRRATRASLAQIGELLSGAEAMLILTDAEGVILETAGDNSTLSKASKINLNVGGLWSEHASGTNGIGTALWAGQPVYVHGEEHFCEGMKPWSCAAAPIRDPVDRSILGVINLSGLTQIFQKHNAAFAATAARDIEISLEHEQFRLNMRLMDAIVGKVPSYSDDPTEGFALVDRFGRLIFSRNSGNDVGKPDHDPSLGSQFLNLCDGLTEENILAALPVKHHCKDVQLIEIDGEIRGAALTFDTGERSSRKTGTAQLLALPGLSIAGTDLNIVGRSDAILEALDTANRIATVNSPALIEGETGVGKELFARLIHSRMDPGNHYPFSAINCGAMTPQMFQDGQPLFSDDGQSVPFCLDEIGEIPLAMQPFLLRILEEQLTGLRGPDQSEHLVRVLSLTNRVLLDEVQEGRFRRDLYYRLSTVSLRIPPLRNRGEDVLLIAEHYNRKIAAKDGIELLAFDSAAQSALMAHVWPGNVRELRNLIHGLHCLAKSRRITLADLPREIRDPQTHPKAPVGGSDHHRTPSNPDVSLKHSEMFLIESALSQHNGNISKASHALGISRPTLYRKIRAFGIGL